MENTEFENFYLAALYIITDEQIMNQVSTLRTDINCPFTNVSTDFIEHFLIEYFKDIEIVTQQDI